MLKMMLICNELGSHLSQIAFLGYEAFFLQQQVGLMLDTLFPCNVPIIWDDNVTINTAKTNRALPFNNSRMKSNRFDELHKHNHMKPLWDGLWCSAEQKPHLPHQLEALFLKESFNIPLHIVLQRHSGIQ